MSETEKPEPAVWLDGVLLPRSEALAPVVTPGWLLGHGVFETIGVRNGRPFALGRHLRRLENAAARLRLVPPPAETLREAVRGVIIENNLTEAVVRITLSAAEDAPPAPGRAALPATQTLAHFRAPPDTSAPLKLATVPWRRNEFSALSGLKTVCYAENSLALEWARRRGAGEALFLNTGGDVCEGAATNLFLVHGKQVVTPWLSSGCLPGVIRGLVLELCAALDIPCLERAVTPADIAAASEIFVTSSGRGVQPAEAADDFLPPHAPGPVTLALSERLAALWRDDPEP